MKNMVETTAGANLVMKAVFAICAFILAIVLLPVGTAHAATTPTLAEWNTWYKGSTAKADFTTVNIVDSYSPTGSEKESWDASAAQDGSVMAYVSADGKTLTLAGNGSGCIKGNEFSMGVFQDFEGVTAFNGLGVLDMSEVKTIQAFFSSCRSVKSLDLSMWDTSSLGVFDGTEGYPDTDMYAVFGGCYALESLKVSGWNVEDVECMSFLFSDCQSLKTVDLSTWNPKSLEKADWLFSACKSLESVKGITGWGSDGKIVRVDHLFYNCPVLESVDLSDWNVSNCVDMNRMFYYDYVLESVCLDGWDTSSCQDFSMMFYECPVLNNLDLSGFDTSGADQYGLSYFAYNDYGLTNIVLGPNFGTAEQAASGWIFHVNTEREDVADRFPTGKLGTTVTGANSIMAFGAYDWDADNRVEIVEPVLAASDTWYQSAADKASFTTINIVDSYTPTGSETESWDASAKGDGSVMAYVSADGATLIIAGNGYGHIMANSDSSFAFDGYTAVTAINGTELLNTVNVTRMDSMFCDCEALKSLNLDNWDVSNVYMFNVFAENCRSLTSFGPKNLRDWDVSGAEWFSSSFMGCESLKSIDVSQWDMSSCGVLNYMFSDCKSLATLDVSNWNLASATKAAYVFRNCTGLSTLDFTNWNTPKILDMSGLLNGCAFATIDVSGLDMGTCEQMDWFFANCKSLTSIAGINEWDVSSARLMGDMFRNCVKLAELDLSNWKTASMTGCMDIFSGCESLEKLDISGFNTSGAAVSDMFNKCYRLQQVTLGADFTFNGKNDVRSVDLPTPDPAYIAGATGNWQAVAGGTVDEPAGAVYAPADVPSNVAETYVMEDVKVPVLAASSSWYSGSTAKSAIVTINIADSYTPTGSEKESWDASAAKDGSVMAYVSADGTTLTIAGNGSGYVKANADSSHAFEGFIAATSINGLTLLNTSGTTTVESMFEFCELVTVIDISGFDMGSVVNMSGMFKECDDLVTITGIEGIDTSKVKNLDELFYYCRAVTALDLSKWDLSSVESMNLAFDSMNALKSLELPSEVAPNLEYANGAFRHCPILTKIDVSFMENGKLKDVSSLFEFDYALNTIVGYENLVTSTTEKIDAFFNYCRAMKNLDVSNWDTSNVSNFDLCFRGLSSIVSLEGLDKLDTSKATSMKSTFGNSAYTSIDGITNWDVSKVTNFATTFSDNWKLKSLDISGWKTSSATTMKRMFYDCPKLEVLDIAGFQTSTVSNLTEMFAELPLLQQVTLGAGYVFSGDGTTTCVLPTPDPAYIAGATGKWQAVASGTVDAPKGTVYLPADVPSNVAETYVVHLQGAPVLAAGSSWYKADAARNTIVTINVVDSYTADGTEAESWDASAAGDGSVMAYILSDGTTLVIAGNGSGCVYANPDSTNAFGNTDDYTSNGNEFTALTNFNGADILDVSKVTDATRMFYYAQKLQALDVSGWDVSNVVTFDSAFAECRALTTLAVGGWDISSAESLHNLFGQCRGLTSLDVSDWDTAGVKDMGSMFEFCRALPSLDVSGFDTSSCTDTSGMFYACTSLGNIDMSGWDTSKVTDMSTMFASCMKFTKLDVTGFDTSSVEDFGFMFQSLLSLSTLDVSGFDTSSATDMGNMFAQSSRLTYLDVTGFDTSKVEDFRSMFNDCESLLAVDVTGFDTTSCTRFSNMFMNCKSLKVLDLSSFDTSKADDMEHFFYNMYRLQQVTLGEKFSFTGNGTATDCVLPTPDPAYITGAIGKWQAVGSGTVEKPAGTIYLPEEVPSNVLETYVMPPTAISVDVPIKVTLAAASDGTWCTPTAAANQIVNHSLVPVKVASAKAGAVDGFTMLANASVASSTASNVFGGTIKAGTGTAQDLTAISASGDAWTMAAETDSDDSDLISLQLAGSIGNVEGKYFTDGCKLFDITYTFELAL